MRCGWSGSSLVPGVGHLRIWGLMAHVKNMNPNQLESHTTKCYTTSLGIRRIARAISLMTLRLLLDHRVFVSRNARFLEDEFLGRVVRSRSE
jgi:hypothetical protein